jgi:23S rRNA pseudouridine955/2504/2580 synthase
LKRVDVLFENDEVLILNKPAGLAVQGGAGIKVSLDRLLEETYCPRPLLVHRLDQDTSGLILTAKNRDAAARFSRLFGDDQSPAWPEGNSPGGAGTGRGLVKQYRALCAGTPAEDSGLIEYRLDIRGMAKTARTAYKRLGGSGEFSLLELELKTGRMHQIRRHLAKIGNPVLGDDKYGDFGLNKRLRKSMGLRRLLLHACRLIISPGPDGSGGLDISAPLPEYFSPFLELFEKPV